jgi:hypothetical protein
MPEKYTAAGQQQRLTVDALQPVAEWQYAGLRTGATARRDRHGEARLPRSAQHGAATVPIGSGGTVEIHDDPATRSIGTHLQGALDSVVAGRRFESRTVRTNG